MEEREEIASVNVSEAEETQEKNPCEHCEKYNVYGTLIMKCPKCSWHDYHKVCPMRYVITRSPREKLNQRGLYLVSRLWTN